jgi:hypothetical protein
LLIGIVKCTDWHNFDATYSLREIYARVTSTKEMRKHSKFEFSDFSVSSLVFQILMEIDILDCYMVVANEERFVPLEKGC